MSLHLFDYFGCQLFCIQDFQSLWVYEIKPISTIKKSPFPLSLICNKVAIMLSQVGDCNTSSITSPNTCVCVCVCVCVFACVRACMHAGSRNSSSQTGVGRTPMASHASFYHWGLQKQHTVSKIRVFSSWKIWIALKIIQFWSSGLELFTCIWVIFCQLLGHHDHYFFLQTWSGWAPRENKQHHTNPLTQWECDGVAACSAPLCPYRPHPPCDQEHRPPHPPVWGDHVPKHTASL